MALVTDTDNALLSFEDGASFLGVTPAASTVEDDLVRDLINAVSYRFNTETGRNLKSRDYTEIYSGDGSNELMLTTYPISSTTITITINANRDFSDTGDEVTSTDVMLSTAMGFIQLDGDSFDSGTKNIQVEYSAGYTTDASFDLTHAAKEQLKLMWNRENDRDTIGVRTEAFEGMSRTFEQDIPWSVRQVLNIYRDRQSR